MSVSTAIGMVSESLRSLLRGGMKITPEVPVTILAPDESSDGERRINLFLYKIKENAALKNMDWQVKPGSPGQLVPPPLSLNLFYLVTAYSTNDPETGNAAAHEILGEAMRVFYENPIIPAGYLTAALKDGREQIKIMLNSLDMEELSQVWATFSKAFRPSVLYEVSVVQLDMLPDRERAMATRVRKIAAPTVDKPFQPPVIEGLQPLSAPAGSAVTVYGKNFPGWKAYVAVTGKHVVEALDLAADSFRVTLPADCPPGFHEVRVDISHLSRRTFFLEVTA